MANASGVRFPLDQPATAAERRLGAALLARQAGRGRAGSGFCDVAPPAVRGSTTAPRRWTRADREARDIRASVVLALLVADAGEHPAIGAGVMIEGAWISGSLDLAARKDVRSLNLKDCALERPPDLTGARMHGLILDNVWVPGLVAPYAEFATVVDIIGGSIMFGRLDLFGAKIAGRLRLDDTRLFCPLAVERTRAGRALGGKGASASSGAPKADDGSSSPERLTAVDASGTSVGHFVALGDPGSGPRRSFACGLLDFREARIGGSLRIGRALYKAVSADRPARGPDVATPYSACALDLSDASVGGRLHFKPGFRVRHRPWWRFWRARWVSRRPFRGRVVLAAARVGVLEDDAEAWPDANTDLVGLTYGRIETTADGLAARRRRLLRRKQPAWNLRRGRDGEGGFRPQPWRQFAHVCRTMGYPDLAARTLIEAQWRQRATQRREAWRKRRPDVAVGRLFWDFALGLSVAFGYRQFRAFWLLLGFVLVGGAVFAWADGRVECARCRAFVVPSEADSGSVMHPGGVVPTTPDATAPFNPWLFSLETFGPIGGFNQASFWPVSRGRFDKGWWVQLYLCVHIAAGWLLSAIFAAGFLGLFKRELD